MQVKTRRKFENGTFCWSGEGRFFYELIDEENKPQSDFSRSLYYTGKYSNTGKYYVVWSNFVHMIWLTILFFSFFSILGNNSKLNIIMLALIALTLFEIIFEARARYIYIYAPLYIIIAMYGLVCIKNIQKESKR